MEVKVLIEEFPLKTFSQSWWDLLRNREKS